MERHSSVNIKPPHREPLFESHQNEFNQPEENHTVVFGPGKEIICSEFVRYVQMVKTGARLR